jgi:hypothetical protein
MDDALFQLAAARTGTAISMREIRVRVTGAYAGLIATAKAVSPAGGGSDGAAIPGPESENRGQLAAAERRAYFRDANALLTSVPAPAGEAASAERLSDAKDRA